MRILTLPNIKTHKYKKAVENISDSSLFLSEVISAESDEKQISLKISKKIWKPKKKMEWSNSELQAKIRKILEDRINSYVKSKYIRTLNEQRKVFIKMALRIPRYLLETLCLSR